MRPKAICLLLITLLLATACSRLTFVRPKGKVEPMSGPQSTREYSVGDSPEVKRRQSVQTLLARAVQRLQAGEPDAAEKDARAALKLDPTSADATTVLAVVEDQRGNTSAAGQHYKRAAELAPSQGAALNNYGTWLCKNGFAAESLVWFDRAIQAPDYATPASAMANAGSCALKSGQAERAARDLRQALAQEPANLQAIIQRISPSLEGLPRIRDKKARMREAVLNNVRHQVHALRQESVIQAAEGRGQIQVIGGYYEIGSGAVDFLIDDADLQP